MTKSSLPYLFVPVVSKNDKESAYIINTFVHHMKELGANVTEVQEYEFKGAGGYTERDRLSYPDVLKRKLSNERDANNYNTMYVYAGEKAVHDLKFLPPESSIAIVHDQKLWPLLRSMNCCVDGGPWNGWRDNMVTSNLAVDFFITTKDDNPELAQRGAWNDPHISIVDYMPFDDQISPITDKAYDERPVLAVMLPQETSDLNADMAAQRQLAKDIQQQCENAHLFSKSHQVVLIENINSKDHSMATGVAQVLYSMTRKNQIDIVTASEKPVAHRLPGILLQHCPGHKTAEILENGKLTECLLVLPRDSGEIIARTVLERYNNG